VIRIDFELIDYVKLILIKNKLKVKWFVFRYICVKVNWIINLCVKINYKIKNTTNLCFKYDQFFSFKKKLYYQFSRKKSIILKRNQICKNLFYISKINFKWIDSIKLITVYISIEGNVIYVRCIYVKVNSTINLNVKSIIK